MYFSGSYLASDVRFLLDIVDKDEVQDIDPVQKETLIQSGQKHYSQMLSLERPPSDLQRRYYALAMTKYAQKYAQDIHYLAYGIYQAFCHNATPHTPIVLVSLLRAGVPVGVLLQRALADQNANYHCPSVHYGISIIKDVGIDFVALTHIVDKHRHSRIVFIDGWTGKGAIFGQLKDSLIAFCQSHCYAKDQLFCGDMPYLAVVNDPAGVAWLSASDVDYLIPHALLNSTVSGLVSRTLYHKKTSNQISDTNQQGFHQSVYYDELKKYDESLNFVDTIDTIRRSIDGVDLKIVYKSTPIFTTKSLIQTIAKKFNLSDTHLIKPTYAEAIRAIVRRDPKCVVLDDKQDDDMDFIIALCEQKNIAIYRHAIYPYKAMTVIKDKTVG